MKELRNYIRSMLIQEGLAGFGNSLFLRRIIDQVKAGNIRILIPRRNTHTFTRAVVFSFPRHAIENIYRSASPELQDWILKKFDNLEFFVRNFSRLKWAITDGYPQFSDALGLAGDNSRPEGVLINNKTGLEVPRTSEEFSNWRVSTKGGKTEHPDYTYQERFGLPADNAQSGAWDIERGFISVKTIKGQSIDLLMKQPESNWHKMIAKYMEDAMNLSGKNSSVWTHELQHWVQNLSYYTSRNNKRNSRDKNHLMEKPYGPVGRTAIYLIAAKIDAKISNVRTEPPYTYADITGLSTKDIEVLKSRTVKSLINPRKDELWPQEVIDHLWNRFGNAGTKQKTKPLANSAEKQKYFSRWKTACVGKLFGGDWQTAGLEIKGITAKDKLVPITPKWISKIVALRLNRTAKAPAPRENLSDYVPPSWEQRKVRSAKFDRTVYNNRFSENPRFDNEWEHRIEELDAEKAANIKKTIDILLSGNGSYPHMVWVALLQQDTDEAYDLIRQLYEDRFKRFRDMKAYKMLSAEQKSMDNIARKITDYLQECVDRVDSQSYISQKQYKELKNQSHLIFRILQRNGWLSAVKKEVNQNY